MSSPTTDDLTPREAAAIVGFCSGIIEAICVAVLFLSHGAFHTVAEVLVVGMAAAMVVLVWSTLRDYGKSR